MPDPEFILLGDALWLDFINTARGRSLDPPDRLTSSADYHRWTKSEKLRSDAGDMSFGEVLAVREHLTALASALASARRIPTATIDALNAMLGELTGHGQLVRQRGRWSLQLAPDTPLSALEAVAWSAATGLSDPLVRIRACAGTTCSLFIADRTPDRSGNRQ